MTWTRERLEQAEARCESIRKASAIGSAAEVMACLCTDALAEIRRLQGELDAAREVIAEAESLACRVEEAGWHKSETESLRVAIQAALEVKR